MVYVLCRVIPYEDHEILGVFDTKELAVNAFHRYTRQKDITFGDKNELKYDRLIYQIETYVLNHCDW